MDSQRGLDFGAGAASQPARRRALTVSQLTDRIQGALEVDLADVWVEGEVSNVKLAPSGHWYFSLKDDHAQVRAVVWRTAARLIKFRPADGMKVLARGGVRVYAPRGEYQLSVEVLEPLGKGSLQQAFEDLKAKLEKEGLFAPARKRPLPLLPRRIGIVTSRTGAVIQDMLRLLTARFANLEILIFPARVQGIEGAAEVVHGIRGLNRVPGLDVLIVARGGGSLEDLWCFNEESVARALAASAVPTISAVGHETDFTIADFVADVRAPTPSAAAERVIAAKDDYCARIDGLARRIAAAFDRRITDVRNRVARVTTHRVFEAERGRIRNRAQFVDELGRRAENAARRRQERGRDRLRGTQARLEGLRLDRQLAARRDRLASAQDRLARVAGAQIAARRDRLGRFAAHLEGLSPLGVLGRGYALVWRDGRLVRSPREVAVGDALRIRVAGGTLGATVHSTEEGA